MKLKVKELQDFFKLASGINSSNIIPILSYIKLENGELVKSNLKTFIQHKISAPKKERLLLEEKVLSAFLKDCKNEEIEVKVEDKNVWLLEGKRKIKFQTDDIEQFPKFPESEKENAAVLDSEVLEAIGTAAKNVGAIGSNEVFDFVHLVKGHVVGTDRAKFFCKKIKGIPDIIIDTETANTISQFNEVNFYQKGKYNFFEVGNTLYGFIQSEVKTPPQVLSFIPNEIPKDFIEIDVREFVSFCDTVMSASASKVLDCNLTGNKLTFVDADYDIELDAELESNGDFVPEINFLPRTFGGYFKSLGFTKVKIAKAEVNNAALSIWSDEDAMFRGLVIGTVMPTKN